MKQEPNNFQLSFLPQNGTLSNLITKNGHTTSLTKQNENFVLSPSFQEGFNHQIIDPLPSTSQESETQSDTSFVEKLIFQNAEILFGIVEEYEEKFLNFKSFEKVDFIEQQLDLKEIEGQLIRHLERFFELKELQKLLYVIKILKKTNNQMLKLYKQFLRKFSSICQIAALNLIKLTLKQFQALKIKIRKHPVETQKQTFVQIPHQQLNQFLQNVQKENTLSFIVQFKSLEGPLRQEFQDLIRRWVEAFFLTMLGYPLSHKKRTILKQYSEFQQIDYLGYEEADEQIWGKKKIKN